MELARINFVNLSVDRIMHTLVSVLRTYMKRICSTQRFVSLNRIFVGVQYLIVYNML